MTIIKARLNDQALSLSASPVVASGGVGEDSVTFVFDDAWTDYTKKAVFYRDESTVYHVDIGSDNTAVIPWEVLQYSGFMYFGVFGTKGDEIKTSTVIRYRVELGAITSATQLDPTPDIFADIILNTAARHSHDNKTVLDAITAEKVSKWDDNAAYVLTDADKAEIVQTVLDRLGGQPVSGVVDANNNIIISGSLADGTYTIKYENADGTYTDIGTFDVGATGPVYTNLFDPAAATLNQRWSNSSYAFTTSGGNGYVVSDYIPIPDISDSGVEHILRFRGGTWAGNAGVHYFNASKGVIQASDASTAGVGVTTASDTPTTDGKGVSQLTLGRKKGAYDSKWASAAYIRMTLQINGAGTAITADDIQDIIITIDEPIVD